MTKFMVPTCTEIHEAYLEGEEAVVALIERMIGQLAARVQAFDDQIVKNNHNSSKPPSSDGLKKPAPRGLLQRRCKSRLALSEIMTIIIYFHQSRYRNFKTYYLEYVKKHLEPEFPKLVSTVVLYA